ncbi:MAG: L-ascorbate metabolism protein UlaG (beta-lactamase superfamily) [Planctomycetota bacterium]|jgi:L-ascorbate metabolism protein UlaG (beta-lactamase superfamily)
MELTFYGHACFSVEIQGKTILFDPFISGNELAKDIDINSIKADYILITHGHQDHVLDVETIAKNTGAKLVSNYEIINWFAAKGIKNGHPMNHGGKWQFDFGTVRYVNAIHTSSMPDGAYGGNPGGFVIESEEGNFYFAGDTALTMDMKLIPMFCKIDFCVYPIGDNFTMGYKDAVLAADFVDCERVVGVHYDTFGYIEINKEKAKEEFERSGKELILPKIGETISL